MTGAPTVSALRISREEMSILILGATIDVAPHRHHALQIAVALRTPFHLSCAGDDLALEGAIIAPGTPHRLDSRGGEVAVLLVEPELAAAREAMARLLGGKAYAPLPMEEMRQLRAFCLGDGTPSHAHMLGLLAPGARNVPERDPRIAALQERLRALPEKRASLGAIAAEMGLSESRLTHLFKEETGVSFRRYLLWLRLGDAMARALAGASLTDAAHAAGFADSAHLSRTCREMFGINPLSVARNSRFVQAGKRDVS